MTKPSCLSGRARCESPRAVRGLFDEVKIYNFVLISAMLQHTAKSQEMRRTYMVYLKRDEVENTKKKILAFSAERDAYSSSISQAVTHPSTNQSRRCLASVIARSHS